MRSSSSERSTDEEGFSGQEMVLIRSVCTHAPVMVVLLTQRLGACFLPKSAPWKLSDQVCLAQKWRQKRAFSLASSSSSLHLSITSLSLTSSSLIRSFFHVWAWGSGGAAALRCVTTLPTAAGIWASGHNLSCRLSVCVRVHVRGLWHPRRCWSDLLPATKTNRHSWTSSGYWRIPDIHHQLDFVSGLRTRPWGTPKRHISALSWMVLLYIITPHSGFHCYSELLQPPCSLNEGMKSRACAVSAVTSRHSGAFTPFVRAQRGQRLRRRMEWRRARLLIRKSAGLESLLCLGIKYEWGLKCDHRYINSSIN